MDKGTLFIIADAGVHTGFAQVTHNLVYHLESQWNIHILGINYHGDPHPIQKYARVYNPSAKLAHDLYGFERVIELIKKIKPDKILIINDPWIAIEYAARLKQYAPEYLEKTYLYTPIDAENIKPGIVQQLNVLAHVIGYTQFGITQLQQAGLQVPTSIIPHGVNTDVFKPMSKEKARAQNRFSQDWFIVNVTDRNQIRKRIDLAFHYFAQWVQSTKKGDHVKLHYHGALMDEGWDILELAESLHIGDRLIITSPNITASEGLPDELMPYIYAVADVGLSTTMGKTLPL